jgi:transposase-like protein
MIGDYVDSFKPQLGELWNVDEMAIKVNQTGDNHRMFNYQWLWNVLDQKTKFLITSMVTKEREIPDARKVFQEAKHKAKSKPKYIVTDGLRSYPKAINKEFLTKKKETVHVRYRRITDKRQNNNNVERLNGTIRERHKVMRSTDNAESAQVLSDAYRIYYNFIRPHMGLGGLTPAQMAGIDLNLGDNKWMQLIKKAVEGN